MELIDGKKLASEIRADLKNKCDELKQKGINPKFAVIMVGNNKASQVYVRNKSKAAEQVGIKFEEYLLDENIKQDELIEQIKRLNEDEKIHGILLQSPIPNHLDINEAFRTIAPEKDVDGFNPVNVGKLSLNQDAFVSCTPYGIMKMLDKYNIDLTGKNVVILGRSNIVGKPLIQCCLNKNATVTVCHSKTKDIVDPVTSASYTTLTSNLAQRYFNDFKTKVHIVGVACLDRSIEAEGTGRKDIITKKEITVNKIKDEKRKIVFRDDSYSVDSKSRFSGIVDEIPLDSDELIKALKDAIQNSKKKKKPVKNAVVKPAPQPEPEDEIEEDIDDVIEDDIAEADEDLMEDIIDDIDEDTSDDYPEDLRDQVKELCKTCEDAELKTKVKGIIKQYGKLSEVDDDGLKEMYDLLK